MFNFLRRRKTTLTLAPAMATSQAAGRPEAPNHSPASPTRAEAPETPPPTGPTAPVSPTAARPLRGLRVAVLGLGASGRAAAKLSAAHGARVTVYEEGSRTDAFDLPEAVGICFGQVSDAVASADLLIRSPGVPADHPALTRAREAGVEIISEVELAARHLDAPVVAITGTNGKSTVTTWVGEILSTWKPRVFSGGNLGQPVSEAALAEEPWDFVVVELSSFQLEDTVSLDPVVSALLNTSPDHMDRYATVGDYYKAKFRIFSGMSGGYAVLNAGDERTALVQEHYLGRAVSTEFNLPESDGDDRTDGTCDGVAVHDGVITVTTGGKTHPIVAIDELQVPGAAAVENAQATAAICLLLGCPLPVVRRGLVSFQGLPHRMQTVRELEGVRYINDSKATNPGAAVRAMAGLGGPVTLLLGGRDKGGDLFTLREPIFLHCHRVVLFGESGERFRMILQGHPDLVCVDTLEEAVAAAHAGTKPGGAVLLSPACASFDAYRSFGERGEHFTRLVEAL